MWGCKQKLVQNYFCKCYSQGYRGTQKLFKCQKPCSDQWTLKIFTRYEIWHICNVLSKYFMSYWNAIYFVLTTTQEPNMVNLRVRFRSNSDNFLLSTVNCAMISPQVIIVPEIISIKNIFLFLKDFLSKKFVKTT